MMTFHAIESAENFLSMLKSSQVKYGLHLSDAFKIVNCQKVKYTTHVQLLIEVFECVLF